MEGTEPYKPLVEGAPTPGMEPSRGVAVAPQWDDNGYIVGHGYTGPQLQTWTNGLFSCFDGGFLACLYGCCLPYCAMASARTKMDRSNCCFNCMCMNPMVGNNVIRESYNIEGDCCGDILTVYFCGPCAVVRAYNEVNARGPVSMQAYAEGQQWSTGLCDCSHDGSSCCYSYSAPRFALAAARTDFDDSNYCFNCCCLGTGPFARNLVRESYGIEGSCIGDICTVYWCSICSTAQVLREVKRRRFIKLPPYPHNQVSYAPPQKMI
eukprot:TRINITY_DN103296_c0_g1_i1.p1 TRINITY_DN103296_c0_g1~~TRINITY_DN103296_c0_g1_i1.p1  ORF type:complete len:272 (+),score=20.58 TRINITY_DN103296_c0_g1_i1:23-817(+)